MGIRKYLKPKNFKIKAKSIKFESVNFMTDLEKAKIYVAFVKLLNNHFKHTLFKKNLYQHFINHCGFMAHYNLHGFYGEYFEKAANYHYNVNGYKNPMHECSGNLNKKSSLSFSEQFYSIYEELNGSRDGLGEFYDKIINNRNYGGYSDYEDLDRAIKDAFSEYMEIWRDELKKASRVYSKFLKDENIKELKAKKIAIKKEQIQLDENTQEIEETLTIKANKVTTVPTQLSLFDFAS